MNSSEQAPRLNPARRASPEAIEEDLLIFGYAFVVNIDGEKWLIHPTQVSVYTNQEDDDVEG